MASVSLGATLREHSGKGAARKLRAAARLPAVVYRAGDPATSIVIDPNAVELAFKKTQNRNTLVEIDIEGGGKRTCLVRDAQRHPVSRRLEHIDFYEVHPDQFVTVTVDVKPLGTSKGVKLGGALSQVRRTLNVRCKPADIPDFLGIDITNMVVGDVVTVAQIPAPKGCEIIFTNDFNVLAVVGRRIALEFEEDEEEGEGEGEGEGEAGEGSDESSAEDEG